MMPRASPVRRFIKFVNALLLSRGCTPLESFWLRADPSGISLENFHETASLWIRHALKSNVEELGIMDHYHYQEDASDGANGLPEFFQLQHCPFTSSYLKKLHLCYVYINNHDIKKLFSSCPALEDLEMINCEMFGIELSSATLKSLSICYDHFPHPDNDYTQGDIVINMHSLVSLHIGALLGGLRLSIADVQSLITTSIYLDRSTTFSDGCKIFGALSNAKRIELLFPYAERDYPLQSDMQLCQVEFANLTSLTLSDWCLHENCKVLLYFLKHSPNLEKLTLKLTEHEYHRYDSWFHSAFPVESTCKETAAEFCCEKLKIVEIICPKCDKIVSRIVTILLTKIKSPPEISIKPFSYPSYWVY